VLQNDGVKKKKAICFGVFAEPSSKILQIAVRKTENALIISAATATNIHLFVEVRSEVECS